MNFKSYLFAASAVLLFACAAHAQTVEWVDTFGTPLLDEGRDVAVDSNGRVYCCGVTRGDFGGQNSGGNDMVVFSYSPGGQQIWATQFGTQASEIPSGVAVDSENNVFSAGFTSGDLFGKGEGAADVVLTKLDVDGNILWGRQYGTDQSDAARSISVNESGDVYVGGVTFGDLGGANAGGLDVFVSKFTNDGDLVWTKQFGSSEFEELRSVETGSDGGVYLTGYTDGDLAGSSSGDDDAFLLKLSADGNLVYATQFGSSQFDGGSAIKETVNGEVFVGGWTRGDLDGPNQGISDSFMAKFDSQGQQIWVRQLGTSRSEFINSMHLDDFGNLIISGTTSGNLDGMSSPGEPEGYVGKFDSDGNKIWLFQVTSSSWDNVGFSALSGVDIYLFGYLEGGERQFKLYKYNLPRPEKKTHDLLTVLRGNMEPGPDTRLYNSDDVHTQFTPGFTLNSNEAPVWLVFDGTFDSDVYSAFAQLESRAGTPGLTFTAEFWNWNSLQYETVAMEDASFGMDAVSRFPANISDHVSFTGDVRSRIGWRATGFTINFPWVVSIDQFIWFASN